MKISLKTGLVIGGVAVAGLLAYLLYKKGGQVLSTTLNPASDQNAAYKGVNAVGQATGILSKDQTWGTGFFDWTHNDDGSFNWFGLSKKDTSVTPAPATANKDLGGTDFGISDSSSWDSPDQGSQQLSDAFGAGP